MCRSDSGSAWQPKSTTILLSNKKTTHRPRVQDDDEDEEEEEEEGDAGDDDAGTAHPSDTHFAGKLSPSFALKRMLHRGSLGIVYPAQLRGRIDTIVTGAYRTAPTPTSETMNGRAMIAHGHKSYRHWLPAVITSV